MFKSKTVSVSVVNCFCWLVKTVCVCTKRENHLKRTEIDPTTKIVCVCFGVGRNKYERSKQTIETIK